MNEQATMMNQQHQQQQHQHLMSLNQNMMSLNQMNQQPQPQMVPMNHGYGMWPQPPPFPKPNPNPGAMKPPSSSFKKSLGPRSNWKGKKVNMPNNKRRNEPQKPTMAGSSAGGLAGGMGNPSFNNYQPPNLNELQHQNRMKTRKFFPKKKFNNNNTMNMNMNMNMIANNQNFNNSRSAPYAPRNTTSFIIRAKKSGGIASLVSPSPKTPAVLPTPIFSPSREVLVDMAKEEWGVDGYGSMKGLIRLRSPGHEMEDEDEGGSSESDVEEHVEMERRLDHDLSRFEMIYNPNSVHVGGMDYHNVLENRVDDQDSHIAQLEDENLILKERLFLIERELGDLRRRMQFLERRKNRSGGETNEEVVENESESESREGHSVEDINEFSEGNNNSNSAGGDSKEKNDAFAESDDKNGKVTDVEGKEENNKSDENNDDMITGDGKNDNKVTDVECEEENNIIDDVLGFEKKTENNDDMVAEDRKNSKVADVKGKAENNNDEYVDANKANKCLNMEVNAVDNINIGSSKSPSSVVEEGDIGMEDIAVLPRDVGNC